MSGFKKFPSIEQLHSVAKLALKEGRIGDIEYIAKIKLHGTNACVRIDPDGTVTAQKRTSDLNYPHDDNAGFAAWLEGKKDYFKNYYRKDPHLDALYIYGEWAGQGIQKGDAVGRAPKTFYPFLIVRDTIGLQDFGLKDSYHFFQGPGEDWIPHSEIKFIPIFKRYTINFFDKKKMDTFVAEVTKDIEEIAKCDPFIKDIWGIEGPGEGLVFYPEDFNSDYMFKVKTEAHMNNKRLDKEIVSFTPEQVKQIDEFCAKYVTQPRLFQGLTETGEIDIKKVCLFIGWICKDISKESVVELDESELDWKACASVITRLAREFYFSELAK